MSMNDTVFGVLLNFVNNWHITFINLISLLFCVYLFILNAVK